MIGHSVSESVSKLGVVRMEGQEFQDRSREVLDILGLDRFTSFCISHFSFGETLGGSLSFEFSPDSLNGRRGCPNAP